MTVMWNNQLMINVQMLINKNKEQLLLNNYSEKPTKLSLL